MARSNSVFSFRLSCAFYLGIVSLGLAHAEDWPAWRGPAGTGFSADKSAPVKWSATENFVWRVALPDRGNSTPIVSGDRVFVTQAIEKEHRRTVMCFSRTDGKLLWQSGVTHAEPEPTNAQNPYCAASPVTDGERVIAYFGSAGLYCYDNGGSELWHRELGQVDSWHGSGSSPILYKDLCILNFGPGNNSALVACNKQSGEVIWKAPPPKVEAPRGLGFAIFAGRLMNLAGTGPDSKKNPNAGAERFANASESGDMGAAGGFMGSWSTPVIVHVGDHDELVVVHAMAAAGYEPDTGKEIWTFTGMPLQVFATPAVADGMLVALGHGSPNGTQVVAIKLGGKGDVTKTHRLWQTRIPKVCVGSGIVTDGCVYLITDHGFIVCLDVASGEKKWEKRLAGGASNNGSWSSIVRADDKLFIPNQSSEVFVLKAVPEFDLLATNSIGDEITCSSLAIADGQIFLRTYQSLWCLGKPQ